jgi:retron-type reverse transcriptase
MKTYRNLYPLIYNFSNLLRAARQAQKGKRYQPEVLAFNQHLADNLLQIQTELQSKTYQAGSYHHFKIYEPKARIISAAPYRDRVVHHALCNVIEPLFERSFIEDTYANRKGKGTHRAILRYQQYCRQYQYVLKCDLVKFFPSIDHKKDFLKLPLGKCLVFRIFEGKVKKFHRSVATYEILTFPSKIQAYFPAGLISLVFLIQEKRTKCKCTLIKPAFSRPVKASLF